MPPPQHPTLPKAPLPSRIIFDPYNSASTGHQRAENKLSGSTSWRDSRSRKLAQQFGDRSGNGGKEHLYDLVGAGSVNFGKDGRKDNGDWEVGAPGLREKGWQDIRDIMGNSRKRASDSMGGEAAEKKRRLTSEPALVNNKPRRVQNIADVSKMTYPGVSALEEEDNDPIENDTKEQATIQDKEDEKSPQIFRGLKMYLNGTTMPLVSDHRLRQLWVQHGGDASLNLGRRTVTHVILAEPGAGGGLAAGKIQKENTTVRGKGIKYVNVKWVLDSIDKGIRQPESRYMVDDVKNRLGGSGQKSVATLFRAKSG